MNRHHTHDSRAGGNDKSVVNLDRLRPHLVIGWHHARRTQKTSPHC
jgi:hypothetical protein